MPDIPDHDEGGDPACWAHLFEDDDVLPPIVSADWLTAHLHGVVVCEVGGGTSGGSTVDDFEAGHVAGARFVSVDDLAGAPGPVVGRHPMPRPEAFAALLGRLGVARTDTVVGYDRQGGAFAARLVWMLRIVGQDAAVLDGGLDSWTGPVESGSPAVPAVDRSPIPWPPEATATADDVVAHLERGGAVVDSRAAERYRGEVEPIDAVAGHVPGAVNLPFAGNLRDGRFLDPRALRQRFGAVLADDAPIVYCGSGVTACHNALAMEHAGLRRPRVYVGSWSGWSTDPDRPVATGER